MNLKMLVEFAEANKEFELVKSEPNRSASAGRRVYDSSTALMETLKSFEIKTSDVNSSDLVEVEFPKGTATPNLYLNEVTAEDRTKKVVGRARLLRIPPVKATAEFILLGASVRFRTYDLFVEFEPCSGDYILCISATRGQDLDYIKNPPPGGIHACIQQGSWRARQEKEDDA